MYSVFVEPTHVNLVMSLQPDDLFDQPWCPECILSSGTLRATATCLLRRRAALIHDSSGRLSWCGFGDKVCRLFPVPDIIIGDLLRHFLLSMTSLHILEQYALLAGASVTRQPVNS